jgi:hypothetical protein
MQMAAESFFTRWAKRKAHSSEDRQDEPESVAGQLTDTPLQAKTVGSGGTGAVSPATTRAVAGQAAPPPTMEDVAKLTPDSDYTRFVARGVDENVRRSALKKLFSDPHFNIMDGLDTYIDDYNTFVPIPPEMLASLNHAKALLDPLSQLGGTPAVALGSDQSDQASAHDDQQQADAAAPVPADSAPQMPDLADGLPADAEPTEHPTDAARAISADAAKFS